MIWHSGMDTDTDGCLRHVILYRTSGVAWMVVPAFPLSTYIWTVSITVRPPEERLRQCLLGVLRAIIRGSGPCGRHLADVCPTGMFITSLPL